MLNSQCLELVQSEEHLVVHLGDLVLADEQFLDLGGTFERVRFDGGDLVAAQIQLDQVGEPSEQAVRPYAVQLVVVKQAE